MAPQATEDRGVSSFSKKYGPILRAPPSSFLGKEPDVTGFTFVSPVLHDEEPEPPSLERGWRRRRRRIGASVLSLKNTDLSSGLRPAPYVRATKGKRPYGQARRLTSPELGNPMQNCHLRKEPCVTFYAVRPLGWNSRVRGDFGAPLRCARNDSSARAIVLYIVPSGGRRPRIAAEPPVQFSGPTGPSDI